MILNRENFNLTFLTNLTFVFFPISLILGNFIINANILLFCCLGIFLIKNKISILKFDLSLKIFSLFFLTVILSTCIIFTKSIFLEGYDQSNLVRLIKSIVYLRFFLLLILIYFLNQLKILKFKYFFIVASVAVLLVSLDIIIQYIFGYNSLGYKSYSTVHNSGFFGDELIAGGFIQDFAFFSIFCVAILLKQKKNLRFLLITTSICVLYLGILFSGNRMPFILFSIGLILSFLLNKQLRLSIFAGILSFTIIFGFVLNKDKDLKEWYISYFDNIKKVTSGVTSTIKKISKKDFVVQEKFLSQKELSEKKKTYNEDKLNKSKIMYFTSTRFYDLGEWKSSYERLFYTALDIWKKEKILGNGIKSFRVLCHKFEELSTARQCSNHPHNYYLEILTDTGIVGITLITTIVFIFIFIM